MAGLRSLLVAPRLYVERIDGGGTLPVAAMIVVGAALSEAIESLASLFYLASAVRSITVTPVAVALAAAAPVVLLGVVWALTSVLIQLVAVAAGGWGSFGQTVKLVGLSFLPYLLGSTVAAIATFLALTGAVDGNVETTAAFVRALNSDVLFRVGRFTKVGFVAWTTILWATTGAASLDVPLWKTVPPALIPGGLLAWLTVTPVL
ncbi:hypothetical protein BRC83_03495 [Halobacteriales archaeon QS_1_68_17]|nr:MAG: hypothetical protein BRC83_03495 [Halobacteriales archaeon QS_1_68_17]